MAARAQDYEQTLNLIREIKIEGVKQIGSHRQLYMYGPPGGQFPGQPVANALETDMESICVACI